MGKDIKGKELGKGISQRSDGYYVGRFTDKFGKRHNKLFKKLQECRKWVADSQYEDIHSNLLDSSNLLVQAFFEYWIDIKEKSVKYNTVRNYKERYENNIKEVIGNVVLKDVKPIHCQMIFSKMADEGYKTTTMYQTRMALYNMFQFAVDNDILEKNPCNKSVKSNIGKESKKIEALTIDEQRKFLEVSLGYHYDLQYRFILQTGIRASELIGLKWSDIDFDKKIMNIERSMEYRYSVGEWKIGTPKSKSGFRKIPLTDEAIEILRLQKEYLSRIKVIQLEWSEFIFLCRKGTPIKNSTYDAAILKRCDKAGIKHISMHVLRHTFATRCIEAGMKPKTLQTILGHSNIGITMNLYVHTTDDEKVFEIDKISSFLKVI